MEATEIKKELHEYIDQADNRFLMLIYGMILADKQGAMTPEWHEAIVEERFETYSKNPEDLISWEALKASIEKMK